MTREQIKEAEAVMQRCRVGTHRLDIAHDILADCYGTIGLLLEAAERALELEPFIDAAMEHEGECDRWKEVHTALDAAIYRAEVKP